MIVLLLVFLIAIVLIESYHRSSRLHNHYHNHCSTSRSSINSKLSDEAITELVNTRSQYRLVRRYDDADSIKEYLDINGIDVIDQSYQYGLQSSWKRRRVVSNELLSLSIMELADKVIDIIDGNDNNNDEINDIIDTVKEILKYQLNEDDDTITYFNGIKTNLYKQSDKSHLLHGRKVADAAFKFTTAGIKDEDLFALLLKFAEREIKRFGYRSSCRSKDVIYFIERLVLAGYKYDHTVESSSSSSSSVFLTAIDILQKKADIEPYINTSDTYQDLISQRLTLFSSRILQSLFRHSSKQDKSGYQVNDHINSDEIFSSIDLSNIFDDITKPLIIDLGCGYGSALSSMCYHDKDKKYNYLGCDMCWKTTSYANAITARWGCDNSIRFLNVDVMKCLSIISESYKGPLKVILINFPTPFKYDIIYDYWKEHGIHEPNPKILIDSSDGGNRELPQNFNDFMISKKTINAIKHCTTKNETTYILGQSNAEDVAVYLQHLFVESGNFVIPRPVDLPASIFNQDITVPTTTNYEYTKRGLLYKETSFPKALGTGFLDSNPLKNSRTETEVQYELDNKKVYRFIVSID